MYIIVTYFLNIDCDIIIVIL